MRWLVEVSSLGKTDTQKFCVDAESWQRALQAARSQRGEDGPMSGFSIELLEEGYRAVDPLARVRFVVKKAPDDMALTPMVDRGATKGLAPAPASARPAAPVVAASVVVVPPAAAVPVVAAPIVPAPVVVAVPATVVAAGGVTVAAKIAPPAPSGPSSTDQTVPNLPATPSSSSPAGGKGAGGAAAALAPKKSPSIAPPRPGQSQPPPANVTGSSGSADEGKKKPQTMVFASTGDAAVADVAVERAAPPAVGSSIPGLPALKLLTAREQNPNEASPLTYREYAFAVPEGTTEESAADVLRAQLRYVEAHIATAKVGKLVNLACFDVEFTGKPPKPPLATLTWKDWKGDPVLAFPRRGGGPSKPTRPPSLEAGALAQPSAQVVGPQAAPVPQIVAAPVAAASPPPQPVAAQPVVVVQPAVSPPAAAPQAPARAQPNGAEAPAAAAQTAPHAPAPQTPAPVTPPPPPAGQEAAPAAVVPPPEAVTAQAPQAFPPPAPAPVAVANPGPTAPVQSFAPAPPPEPVFAEADPGKNPSQPPAGGMVRTPSGRFVRGRVSGDELITSLFESMHDLHFLRDALDGGQFCLALATEVLPARAAIIHFFDIEKREWVVACTRGKETHRLLTMRSAEGDEILREAARKRRALVVPNASNASAERYRQIGGGRSLIVAPIMQAGRALGALEIINPLDGMPFTEDEGNAMTYIAEQFAEYLGSRGIVLDRERIHSAAAAR